MCTSQNRVRADKNELLRLCKELHCAFNFIFYFYEASPWLFDFSLSTRRAVCMPAVICIVHCLSNILADLLLCFVSTRKASPQDSPPGRFRVGWVIERLVDLWSQFSPSCSWGVVQDLLSVLKNFETLFSNHPFVIRFLLKPPRSPVEHNKRNWSEWEKCKVYTQNTKDDSQWILKSLYCLSSMASTYKEARSGNNNPPGFCLEK